MCIHQLSQKVYRNLGFQNLIENVKISVFFQKAFASRRQPPTKKKILELKLSENDKNIRNPAFETQLNKEMYNILNQCYDEPCTDTIINKNNNTLSTFIKTLSKDQTTKDQTTKDQIILYINNLISKSKVTRKSSQPIK